MKSALLTIDMKKVFKDLKNEEFENTLTPNIINVLNIARDMNI